MPLKFTDPSHPTCVHLGFKFLCVPGGTEGHVIQTGQSVTWLAIHGSPSTCVFFSTEGRLVRRCAVKEVESGCLIGDGRVLSSLCTAS